MMNDNSRQESDASIDLAGILKRRKGFLALGLFLGIAAAVTYHLITPPTYRAEMEILVGQKSGSVASGASSGAADVDASQAEEDVLSTQIQLFTSRRILLAAIKKAELTKLKSFKEAAEDGVTPDDFIRENLAVTKGGDGVARDAHTLKATYDDTDPADCAYVLQSIFDEYEKYLKDHFEGTSGQAIALLTTSSRENAQAVKTAESELTQFMASTNLLWDGEKTKNVHKERLANIEVSLSALDESLTESSSRLAVIQEFLTNTGAAKISDMDRLSLLSEKEVGRLKLMFDVTKGDSASEAFQAEQPIRQQTAQAEYTEYLQLVMKEKRLLEQFSSGHPSVISVREQIELLRKFIDKNSAKLAGPEDVERMEPEQILATYLRLLSHDIAEGEKKRQQLLKRSDEELKAAKQLEIAEMKVAALRNEVTRCQGLYDDSLATLKELSFVKDYAGYSTDVIGDAEPQTEAVWPKLIILLALGGFAGGGLGFILAVIADLSDTTFADPADVAAAMGAPVFAHVPQMPSLRDTKKNPLVIDPTLYAFHKPRSPEAEVFRVLRTSLLCTIKDRDWKVIQVTSPQPGDGKSTSAANLAVSIAQTGRRTLLIDADLRRPRVAELFRTESKPGLSEILKGKNEPLDVIRESAVENLSLITSGRRPKDPAELLESQLFTSLIEMLSEKFDIIIIDSPPVLAVSDAAVISESCDAALIALRIVKHGRAAAIKTREILDQHQVNILGLSINGLNATSSNYGYKNSAGKGSYSYQSDTKYKQYYTNAVDDDDEQDDVETESEVSATDSISL
ncbi:MAG: polysaccharide biosynthesis tyrosine autokinase [Fuerstiella sp.]